MTIADIYVVSNESVNVKIMTTDGFEVITESFYLLDTNFLHLPIRLLHPMTIGDNPTYCVSVDRNDIYSNNKLVDLIMEYKAREGNTNA